MNFGQAIKSGFSNYVTFSGRAARSEFWYWTLFVVLVTMAAGILDRGLFDFDESTHDRRVRAVGLADILSAGARRVGAAAARSRPHRLVAAACPHDHRRHLADYLGLHQRHDRPEPFRSRSAGRRLARPDQLDRFVFAEQIEQVAQRLAALTREAGIARQNERGVVARGAEIFAVEFEAGDAEAGQAALARAEQVAFAAQLQVFLGNAEAVFGLAQSREPRLGGFAERRLVEQQASRVAGARGRCGRAADGAARGRSVRRARPP